MQVALINTIAHGSRSDLSAEAEPTRRHRRGDLRRTLQLRHRTKRIGKRAKRASPRTAAATNQTAAPLFANLGTDDFHELAGSPTIGAGVSSPANGLTDLDGVPRQFGGVTDIGAYQFVPAPPARR